jgi:putative endonuclease
MPFTYMLECGDGSFYVGSTWNLSTRLQQHTLGMGGDYTSKRLPVRLVWSAEFDRIDDAYALEKRVQGWSRAKRIALIEGRFELLPPLSSRTRRRTSVGFEAAAQPGVRPAAPGAPQPAEPDPGFETRPAAPGAPQPTE